MSASNITFSPRISKIARSMRSARIRPAADTLGFLDGIPQPLQVLKRDEAQLSALFKTGIGGRRIPAEQKTPILIRESALVPSKAPLQELGHLGFFAM
jgi:hypothetical protein